MQAQRGRDRSINPWSAGANGRNRVGISLIIASALMRPPCLRVTFFPGRLFFRWPPVSGNRRANERTSEQANKRISRRADERTSGRTANYHSNGESFVFSNARSATCCNLSLDFERKPNKTNSNRSKTKQKVKLHDKGNKFKISSIILISRLRWLRRPAVGGRLPAANEVAKTNYHPVSAEQIQ